MPTPISEPVMTSHDPSPLHHSTRAFKRRTSNLFASRSSAIRVAPPPLLPRHPPHRPTLLGTHLHTSPPDFCIPSREDSLLAKHRYSPPPLCHRMLSLLRRLAPLDARGRPKRTSALCCDCLRYRPTKKSYWKKDGERYTLVKPRIGAWEIWDSRVSTWTSRFSFQCPTCWLKERMEVSEKADKIQRRLP